MKITLRVYQAIQSTSEDNIVQKYSRKPMCRVVLSNNKPEVALDRHVSVKTVVLNGSDG